MEYLNDNQVDTPSQPLQISPVFQNSDIKINQKDLKHPVDNK